MSSGDIHLYEVALTDGLFSSGVQLSAETRTQIVELLADCGLSYVEVGPLLARDGEAEDPATFECACRLGERAETTYAGLMRDPSAYPLIRRTALDSLSIRLHACEQPFEQIGASWGVSNVALALDEMEPWLPAIVADGYRVRVTILDALQSIQNSRAGLEELVFCARGLLELGCFQVSFCDTCGTSVPREIHAIARALIDALGSERIAFQLGNALGRGLANLLAARQAGVRHFDTILSGIGCGRESGRFPSCLATEDVVAFCRAEGIETGVDLQRLVRIGRFTTSKIGVPSCSLYAAMCDEEGLLLQPGRRNC